MVGSAASIVNGCCSTRVRWLGKSKGAVAITNYGEVIAAKIKTCHSNFRSGSFDPWRSSDFDPCRNSGVKLWSNADRLIGRQSEEGRRVERIRKGIEATVGLVNFVTQRTVLNQTNKKL